MLDARTIWMNVTTSATWMRPVVGIVRVEQSICEALEKLVGKERFKRCVWNGQYFVECDRSSMRQPSLPHPDFAVPFPSFSAFDPIERLTVGDRSPKKAGADTSIAHAMAASHPAPMKFGDVIVSMGLDWDHGYGDHFHHLITSRGISIVGCCHDLIPVLFPQYCVSDLHERFLLYFKNLPWSCSAIACVSEQSKSDLDDYSVKIGAPRPNSFVFPMGDNLPSGTQAISAEISLLCETPYLMFVSTIERRKNHETLYRAYHLLCRRGFKDKLPRIIFVGMRGWGVNDFLKDLELDPLTEGLFVELNHVNDAELAYLYERTQFCLYPSLYEGWGLPVGEALAMGKVIITSNRGSLTEVGGDLVQYVDPWNVTGWADAIIDLLLNPKKIQIMEKRTRATYQPRNWTEAARIIAEQIAMINPTDRFPIRLEPGYDFTTQCGIHCGPSIVSTSEDGDLLCGPDISLPAASYRMVVHMEILEISGGGSIDVIIEADHPKDTFKSVIDFADETILSLSKKVEILEFSFADPVINFTCTFKKRGNFVISINLIAIEIMDPATPLSHPLQEEMA